MPVKATTVSMLPDYGWEVVLRELEDGADGSLGYSSAAIVEVQRATPRWMEAQPLEGSWTVRGHVAELEPASDATFVLEISSSVTSGGARTLQSSLPLTAIGEFTLSVDSTQLANNVGYLHVGVRIAGSLPHRILWSAQMRSAPSNPNRKG